MTALTPWSLDRPLLAKLVGESPVFLEAIADLPCIARSDAAVLISGATGTGKELVARAIHYLGKRAGFPFVPINCGSFPESLLEEELFGHERGAFTDARQRRAGLIVQADGGTLFLDEVDSLPPKAQVDLLRVLQDRTFRVIGSSLEQKVNVQVVAATNAPLEELVSSGNFRSDLYYRLAVFLVNLPPLRARREDVLPLANHFLLKHSPPGKQPLKLLPDACAALVSWHWPGNVRELENAIIRGIHLTRSDSIEADDLRLSRPASGSEQPWQLNHSDTRPLRALKRELIESFERHYLTHLLAQHSGNISRAAQVAGKERRDLGRLLKKYGLDPKGFRPVDGGEGL
jgi:DNA-binding NtrC family response regulator